MRRARAYEVAVVVLVAAAVLAVWLLTRGASQALAELDPDPVPVAAPVTSADLDFAADGTLTATLGPGPDVLASALAGTVTSVSAAPGSELAAGAPVYAVDGVPVVGYAGETVLYRALRIGDEGDDVRVAQGLLASLTGRETGQDGRFGASTAAAVRAYERSLGVAEPTGELRPEWFTRLPVVPFVVDAVAVQPGQPAPAAGEPVATAAATATAYEVDSGASGPPGDYVFVTPTGEVPVIRAEDGSWSVADDAAALRLVLASPATGGAVTVSGRVRLTTAEPGQSVPGAAVVTDASGATCVVDATAEAAVPVVVVGAGVDGTARIRPTLDADATVLVNPSVVVGDVTCPSG
ncbi:peptidoglycan-binding protein [Cellulomonas sp. C5510]|uniref:peptidoglycan-binding domain-containing protein n=1 Tax=Cellulomonas sp. C5510 TaxID=2871170 RepID=UPI001C965B34|nr:peptidoglycan-binding domain-containing protein [Cellulomonas sp. C5510]QZN85240.1 peptidoglycan-binding protein [Cellulomonas sp. C5510]